MGVIRKSTGDSPQSHTIIGYLIRSFKLESTRLGGQLVYK